MAVGSPRILSSMGCIRAASRSAMGGGLEEEKMRSQTHTHVSTATCALGILVIDRQPRSYPVSANARMPHL